MTFVQAFQSHFNTAQCIDLCLRLLLACALGSLVGIERSKRFKEAGIRTHLIVCCGAALVMIVSKYGFADLTLADGSYFSGTRGADPARIAAQVVSGISFLGAGVIFKNGSSVKGLTTAAGLWFTAGVGLAAGAGMFTIAIVATVLVCLLQVIMHRHAIGGDAYATNRLQFTVKNGFEFNRSLTAQLELWKAQVTESRINRRRDGTTEYDITVRRREEISYDEMKAFMDEHEEIISGSNSPLR